MTYVAPSPVSILPGALSAQPARSPRSGGGRCARDHRRTYARRIQRPPTPDETRQCPHPAPSLSYVYEKLSPDAFFITNVPPSRFSRTAKRLAAAAASGAPFASTGAWPNLLRPVSIFALRPGPQALGVFTHWNSGVQRASLVLPKNKKCKPGSSSSRHNLRTPRLPAPVLPRPARMHARLRNVLPDSGYLRPSLRKDTFAPPDRALSLPPAHARRKLSASGCWRVAPSGSKNGDTER
ncbi:hypothetical protein DFH11DRAFT_1723398 [Phellopilus nigrolimitatus]|nr:hypothetical protein DFH11DRAFT_1723398 [Phellopilus nigrolimitatus]